MAKQVIKFRSNQIVSAEEGSKEIIDIAKMRGIAIPSSHLGFFKTIYAEIENPNLNKIRLGEEAVKKALPGLIGSQVNFEHLGAGFLFGSILDGWINDKNQIEVVYSFFKSIYPEEYERSIELAKEGKLAVSFELMSEKDSQEYLADDTIRLNDIDFQGMGHLMENSPACPKAKIYQYASELKNRLSHAENMELVFASQIEQTCDAILKEENEHPALPDSKLESDNNTNIDAKEDITNKSEQGGNIKVTEEQKAKIEELRKELGDFAKDVSDEALLDEVVVAEIRKEKEAKTAEAEPEKVEEKVESKEEPIVEKAEETEKSEEKLAMTIDSVEIRTYSLESKDGVETLIENVQRITTTDYQIMQDAVAKVAELEESLKAKDSEIETVKANAEKIATVKLQLKDNPFAKDFTDEDYLSKEKVAQAIQSQKNAETIASRKEELKGNEYAKDFSEEDYLNDVKVELAKVKKEKDELEAKSQIVKEKIEASEKKDEEMETGTVEDKKDEYQEVMASVRKAVQDKKDKPKVYTRK